jgi:predicted PurR-regulated permease PerM
MLPFSDGLHPRRCSRAARCYWPASTSLASTTGCWSAAFVGLIEIVPIIGPLIGSILVLAVCLPQSLHVAALSLLWLVVVRESQSYVVNPHIGRTVGLSPLVTLLSVAVVGVLFGGSAVILAVPVTSAVATLIDVLVFGHEPRTEQPRRSLRLRRSG